MFPNAKGSELIGVIGTVPAQAVAGASVDTGWISVAGVFSLLAMIEVGALGASATVSGAITQAQDASGTGAKALKSIPAMSTSNQISLADVLADSLDSNNGFGFVKLAVTVTGASSLVSAKLFSSVSRFYPASASNVAGVSQIV